MKHDRAAVCPDCGAPVTRGWSCASHHAERLGGIGVPPTLRAATFETSTPTRAIEHARAFVEGGGVARGRLLGLLGPTGVGKSWAAAAIVDAELAARGGLHRWVLCSTLLRELRDYRLVGPAVESACSARLLVLDDFQATIRQEVALTFEEILLRREQDGRAVVFTSNLKIRQLPAALSDRVLDRIRAWGDLHEVPGQSLRGGR